MKPQYVWWLFLAMVVVVPVYWLAGQWRRRRRLKKIQALPFPESWREILRKNLPVYRQLPNALRNKLEQDIKWFLADKYFDGRDGLEITDEVRLTIAGQACLLLLGRKNHRCYPKLERVVMYPDAYVATSTESAGDAAIKRPQVRLGESWQGGAVVLSWRHVLAGARRPHDGENVVLHEFAHRLDQLSGQADGAPILDSPGSYRHWATVMSKEFSSLRHRLQLRRSAWLNAYGATNPAEFFAVLTEYFFEKPHALKRHHPQLFAIMKSYYGIDPGKDLKPETHTLKNEKTET